MKNKTKKAKMKAVKSTKPGKTMVPKQWFYMTPEEITVRTIQSVIEESDKLTVQIWEEAGVLELEIKDAKSVEFEATQVDLQDEYSNEFLSKHEIKSLFYVNIDPDNYEYVNKLMKNIVASIGGIFCGDTEDFTPVVA